MKRVYFLRRATGDGPIKIGCSECPEARRKQIGINLKAEMVLLADAPGDFRTEARLHRQFAGSRLEGEWFNPAPGLLSTINFVARTGKLPPPPEEDREIVFARRYLAGETLEQIAAGSGLTRERVRQLLRKTGIPSLGYRDCHKRHSIAEQKAEQVIALAKAGRTVPQIARAIGDTGQNVANCLRRHGVEPIKGKRVPTQKTVAMAREIARRYVSGEKTASIAQAFGIQQPTIYRFLQVAGVEPSRGHPIQIDDAAIVIAFRRGDAMRKIASTHGISHASVSKALRRNGIIRSAEEAEAHRVQAVRRANIRRVQERRAAA